jgi:hypothetical protein
MRSLQAFLIGATITLISVVLADAEVRSGMWTYIHPSADSAASKVDFSNYLTFCGSMGSVPRCSLKVTDCFFRYRSIIARNGVYYDSSINALFGSIVSRKTIKSDREALFYLDSMAKKSSLEAPQGEYSDSIPAQSGVFFVKTSENRSAVMIKAGEYMGDIERMWFYWAYQPDSGGILYRDRLFDLPDTLKIAADVFSGRPNPVFTLTDSAAIATITHEIYCAISTLLDSTNRRSDTNGCPGGLGYRKLSVSGMFPQDNPIASYLPYIEMCQGKIHYYNMPASAPLLYDKGSRLEKLIIRIACEKNLSVTDQYGTVKLCDVVPDSLKPGTPALHPDMPGNSFPVIRCRVRSHEIQFRSVPRGVVNIACFSLGGKCLASIRREAFSDGVITIEARDCSMGTGAYILSVSYLGLKTRGMIFPVFMYR